MSARKIAVLACSVLLVQCRFLHAILLNIATGISPSWTVNAGGAQDVAPYVVNGGNDDLSITSNSFSTGTPVSGLNLATFDGYWTANLPFFVPASAVNPILTFSNLTADDRVVLELNGVQIGNAGYSSGLGSMTLTDHGANNPYQFSGNDTSGTIKDGFIFGAPNLLQAIVNNTGNGINGSPSNISASDGTDFGMQGAIAYATVPEPATGAIALIGLAGVRALGAARPRRPNFLGNCSNKDFG